MGSGALLPGLDFLKLPSGASPACKVAASGPFLSHKITPPHRDLSLLSPSAHWQVDELHSLPADVALPEEMALNEPWYVGEYDCAPLVEVSE